MRKDKIIKYKEGFICKFKNIFKRVFRKQEEKYNMQEVITKEEVKEKHYNFVDKLKVDGKKVDMIVESNNFFKEVEGNEKILNMLSIDRLEKLEKYYDNIIDQNNKKIKELKSTV